MSSNIQHSAASAQEVQKHSCLLCNERKVKCDRREPCSNCTKSSMECVYRAFQPPRRGKKRTPEELHNARLKRYQEMSQQSDAQIDESDGSSSKGARNGRGSPTENVVLVKKNGESHSSLPDTGKLIVEGVRSRYVQNNLWKLLSAEAPQELLGREEDDASDEATADDPAAEGISLIWGSSPAHSHQPLSHPSPLHCFKLWQIFLDNVDPLLKILHAPTIQQQILVASENPENIPKPLEALMFSIYYSAVVSLTDSECESMFGESKAILGAKYLSGVRQALSRAHLLKTTDLMVLQAFLLFLLSFRVKADAETIFSLTGIAVRRAQTMGLHRDGSNHSLGPFQVELRRRLWWQLMLFDGRASELTGQASQLSAISDTRRPLNLNDSELSPEMRHFPTEHVGPTQMSFPLLRTEVAHFMQRVKPFNPFEPTGWSRLGSTGERGSLALMDKAIDELDSLFQKKYIRVYDRSVPIQFLTMNVATLIICKMRWAAHHPRQSANGDTPQPSPSESTMLFTNAIQIMDMENAVRLNPAVQRYSWHSNSQSQWDAYIYVFSELRTRTHGQEVADAWRTVEQTFTNRPELIAEKKPLHVAVGNVALAAWEAYYAARKDPKMRIPTFVAMLRAQRPLKSDGGSAKTTPSSVPNAPLPTASRSENGYPQYQSVPQYDTNIAFLSTLPYDDSTALSSMDWANWDNLLMEGVDAYNMNMTNQFMPL